MALHYQFVFGLLIFQAAVFLLLLIPLPAHWRRNIFRVASASKLVQSFIYWLKVVYVFVFVLLLDAVNRMIQIDSQLHEATAAKNDPRYDPRSSSEIHARKFYAQRNVYLCGFTLFLGLILTTTYSLIQDLLKAQTELETVKKTASQTSKDGSAADAELRESLKREKKLEEEVNGLKKKHQQEIEALKKQHDGQNKEYTRIADQLAEAEKKLAGGAAESNKDK
ncbi:B-cell receptor-associated 31-like protein [Ramicandelaber brevisporus]|nr:B-cell receptor-associated 31-like protein [Ramicandelaber brevisporus]